jgi:hypothetical protein
VRIERAIDAFLDWRQLERDATVRSLDSYPGFSGSWRGTTRRPTFEH